MGAQRHLVGAAEWPAMTTQTKKVIDDSKLDLGLARHWDKSGIAVVEKKGLYRTVGYNNRLNKQNNRNVYYHVLTH